VTGSNNIVAMVSVMVIRPHLWAPFRVAAIGRDRLQVVMAAELLETPSKPAKRLDLPMARGDAVKAAAALGNADRQVSLL